MPGCEAILFNEKNRIAMKEFNSAIIQKKRLLPGIHGLRGIAALGIVLFHLQHLTGIKPPASFQFIGRDFGYGVHLFFILSAFSLMHSTEYKTTDKDWITNYFIKRFFRIAPLFYFIAAFEIGRQAFSGGIVTDLTSIFLNLTFTFGFVSFSGLVWGGWSIGVEMIFYAIFPVLLLTLRNHKSALIFLFFAIVVSGLIRSALHTQHVNATSPTQWDWSYFAFGPNLCFFAMGIYAYRVSHLLEKEAGFTRFIIPLIAVASISALMFFGMGKYLYNDARWDIVAWGLSLTALCIWQSLRPSFTIANKPFEYCGEQSFSIYLIHPIAITFLKDYLIRSYEALLPHLGAYAFFVCAALIIAATLIVARFTYKFIEVPGIRLGQQLIARRAQHECRKTTRLRIYG